MRDPRLPSLAAALIFALSIFIGLGGGMGQSSLDATEENPFWLANAPQERSGPLRSGYLPAQFVGDILPQRLWRATGFGVFDAGPVMDNEKAYVVDVTGNVSAINLTTGKLVWSTELKQAVSATPTIANGRLYVASDAGKTLYALSLQTGAEIKKATLAGATSASPLAAEGRIYIGNDAGTFQVFDANSLELQWTFSTGTTKMDTANGTVEKSDTTLVKKIRTPAAFHEGRVFFGAHNGRVYAMSATGNVHGNPTSWYWNQSLPHAIISAAPVVESKNDRLLVSNGDGKLYAYTISSGTLSWSYDLKQAISHSASVSEDVIAVVGSEGKLVALDLNGKLLWSTLLQDNPVSGPIQTKDVIIQTTTKGNVLLYNKTTGNLTEAAGQKAQWRLDDRPIGTPAVTTKGILLTDQSGSVTLLGPVPNRDANLRANGLDVTGSLTPESELNITVRFENLGPHSAYGVTASFFVDGVQKKVASLPELDTGGASTWQFLYTESLSVGEHTLEAQLEPVGARDATFDNARVNRTIEILDPNDNSTVRYNEQGMPLLPDGSIDFERFYAEGGDPSRTSGPANESAEGDAQSAGEASFIDGLSGAINIWLMLPLTLAAAGGMFGAQLMAKRKSGGAGEGDAESADADLADEDDDWDDDWEEEDDGGEA